MSHIGCGEERTASIETGECDTTDAVRRLTTSYAVSGQVSLPIEQVLPELLTALAQRDELVLQAPPGAGKTTLVPLAVLSAEWLQGQRILLLEPRRIAARAAAERMAKLLGEPVGQTVGYRVRLDSNISAASRIEVVTEGILTRYLQTDPSLSGIGLVIFDEFHERSLDADLGLALTLQGRKLFRDPAAGELPLKLLLMSATLEDTRIAQLLSSAAGAAPIIRSEGRQFPVTVHYGEPWQAGESMVPRVVSTVLQVIRNDIGSVLVFLPGQSEIRAVNQALNERLAELGEASNKSVLITPLFGDLSLAEQRRAIEPAPPGQRKIVLATAIAESSLTIEGVTVVVDAGLSRIPIFDPRTGMTRLQTRRLSRAASVQRMGRAGRLQAGQCYRLWSASQQEQLQSFTPPEIVQADLAPLALQLVCWGVDDPSQLDWLDPPPTAPYQQALELLAGLGAIEQQHSGVWRSTRHGDAMATFPAHPRMAHLLLQGEALGLRNLACDLAALLGERDPLYGVGADLALRLDLMPQGARVERNLAGAVQRLRQQSQQFKALCQNLPSSAVSQSGGQAFRFNNDQQRVAYLLACAYPDRIALRRQLDSYDYLLSNGRAARLHAPDSLQQSPCLVIAQLGGQQGGRFEQTSHDQIYMAAPLDLALFDGPLQTLVSSHKVVEWDKQNERLRAETQRRVGRLVLSSASLEPIPLQEKRTLLLSLLRKRGLSVLPWADELRQWQGRVLLLRSTDLSTSDESVWPDLSDEALMADLEQWLAPYLDDVNQLSHFARLDLSAILLALLPWPLPKRLDEEAPVKLKVPSGSQITLDYCVNPPVLAVKLQELFGCASTPTIAQGRVAVMLHLLSPARRPLAVTQDLASFWQNAYDEVKKQGRGRYPKHPWPDDPLATQATSRTKHGAKLPK